MAKVRMLNPYSEEEIKVKEDCKRISECLHDVDLGNFNCLQLHQTSPNEALITISPKLFSKIEFCEDAE